MQQSDHQYDLCQEADVDRDPSTKQFSWVYPAIGAALAVSSLACFHRYASLHWKLIGARAPLAPLDQLKGTSETLAIAALIWAVLTVRRGPWWGRLVATFLALVACATIPVVM